MISIVLTEEHSYTMKPFLASWGRALAGRIELVFYEELPQRRQLPAGTYIFSDLERLTPAMTQIAVRVWEQLSQTGPRVQLLNHPARAMRRYELLHTLHESGRNRFRATRATEAFRLHRFPVFLREENEHGGSLTPLLRSQEEVDRTALRLVSDGYRLRDLLVVEFCDTSDGHGLFRKYSAHIVGDQILSRQVLWSRDWVVKRSGSIIVDEEWARENREYTDQNLHADWLREIFRLARIDYGRIDYGMLGSEPQVWEINTNPMLFHFPERYNALQIAANERFAVRLNAAFEALDSQQDRGPEIPIALEPNLTRALRAETRKARRNHAYHNLLRSLMRKPAFQPLARILKLLAVHYAAFFARVVKFLGRGKA